MKRKSMKYWKDAGEESKFILGEIIKTFILGEIIKNLKDINLLLVVTCI